MLTGNSGRFNICKALFKSRMNSGATGGGAESATATETGSAAATAAGTARAPNTSTLARCSALANPSALAGREVPGAYGALTGTGACPERSQVLVAQREHLGLVAVDELHGTSYVMTFFHGRRAKRLDAEPGAGWLVFKSVEQPLDHFRLVRPQVHVPRSLLRAGTLRPEEQMGS